MFFLQFAIPLRTGDNKPPLFPVLRETELPLTISLSFITDLLLLLLLLLLLGLLLLKLLSH